ncbi:MAG: hypothetical protein IKR86_05105 [Candidatus Methanomethylophilaceae archaeon]|nr:hypothetical protein [Candidatus Methanomethylophilaceae archaeon]
MRSSVSCIVRASPDLARSGTEATMGHPCLAAIDGRRLFSGPKAPRHPRPLSQDRGHPAHIPFISSKDSMSHPVMVSSATDRTFALSASDSFSMSAHPVHTSFARGASDGLSAFFRLPM